MMTLLWTLLGALLSIILYPVIMPFIEGPIQIFLAKCFGNPTSFFLKRKIRLSGEWMQVWVVDGSTNFPNENESSVIFGQFGKKVYGEARHDKSNFTINGTIDRDLFVTGLWEDVSDGNNYKGSFQLYIHKYATHMTGKWVGYSENNTIRTGEWLWRRITENEYRR